MNFVSSHWYWEWTSGATLSFFVLAELVDWRQIEFGINFKVGYKRTVAEADE